MVFETGQPGRVDRLDEEPSAVTALAREHGARSSVGAPIEVEGRLWGVIIVASVHEAVLPPGTERELAAFTGLVATAIANAEARADLTASRARIVSSADETRRQIVRDLHDGAQQRVVQTILTLELARRAQEPTIDDAQAAAAGRRSAGARASEPIASCATWCTGILPSRSRNGAGLISAVDELVDPDARTGQLST